MCGAPIDPLQLLKALGPLLSPEGGIKSEEEVPRLSCLMKKFSRKLVSRCVYCNVLKATQADVMTAFLDESGWNTINKWLMDARSIENNVFLLEMLRLCQILPMTVERLKENNTAKVIKALTKNEDQDVKTLALDVVNAWMSLIKGERSEILSAADKFKKKKRKEREEKELKEMKVKENKERNVKLERIRKERESLDEDVNKYEDVVIKMPIEEPVNKKPKVDRPKTVKTYQAKFRSTGLEEDTPLPKDVTKKTATINRSEAVAAAKNAVKRMNTSKQLSFTAKKIKPANLINPDNNHNTGLIKLIPPKPKPIHILQESGSFIDALVAAPTQPLRRKKKAQSCKSPTTPPSPTTTPPKLQFYKDTLEMTSETTEEKDKELETKAENAEDMEEKSESVDSNENKSETAINDEITEPMDAKEIDKESKEQNSSESSRKRSVNGQLCSILTHGKRREKKKSVRWAEESDLKQIYYFEMDETERVNVNHVHNFGDLKSMEIKRERKAFEHARRLMGDKMEESIPWMDLIPIDLPAAPVERGCNSKEKEIQMVHQQSTLQDIYFSREMLPETPHEPEQESVTPQEPKTIPLEDVDVLLQDSNPGSIMDFSTLDLPPPKTEIPSVLSNLMMSIANPDNRAQPPTEMPLEHVLPSIAYPNHHPNIPVSGGGNVSSSAGLLGSAPPGYEPIVENHYTSDSDNLGPDWDSKGMPPDQFSDPFYHVHRGVPAPNIRIPPPPKGVRPRMLHPPPIRGPMPEMQRGRGLRPMGPPRRKQLHILCRNFRAGTCKYGKNCNFLHPGLNGPPL